jgi:hypothetical protein
MCGGPGVQVERARSTFDLLRVGANGDRISAWTGI